MWWWEDVIIWHENPYWKTVTGVLVLYGTISSYQQSHWGGTNTWADEKRKETLPCKLHCQMIFKEPTVTCDVVLLYSQSNHLKSNYSRIFLWPKALVCPRWLQGKGQRLRAVGGSQMVCSHVWTQIFSHVWCCSHLGGMWKRRRYLWCTLRLRQTIDNLSWNPVREQIIKFRLTFSV